MLQQINLHCFTRARWITQYVLFLSKNYLMHFSGKLARVIFGGYFSRSHNDGLHSMNIIGLTVYELNPAILMTYSHSLSVRSLPKLVCAIIIMSSINPTSFNPLCFSPPSSSIFYIHFTTHLRMILNQPVW